ncbi:MAG: iron-regulated protein [Planctomycetes bacterium]|nr:iron-regulated protein [Planctomycetota bacterium]
MPRRLAVLSFCLAGAAAVATGQQPTTAGAPTAAAAVAERHAAYCHALYTDCLAGARQLQRSVDALLAAPSAAALDGARSTWTQARQVYGASEALRFHGGPIDDLEPLLNAWPLDEAYIDHVIGRPTAGIVHDCTTFPNLSQALLVAANERGGETNVSVGWHAIEFLLWGQDPYADGPGRRPHTDYVTEHDPRAVRRGAYLRLATAALVEHLQRLVADWAPDADNFRRRFVAAPDDAVRRMLTGTAILTAFELCGERLAVAYETRDQEQEHSCFSDTTHFDLVANQLGIVAVFDGGRARPDGPCLLDLVRARDAAIADHLAHALAATTRAMRAIPAPFDQAFQGADDAPGRAAIRAAMAALDVQAEAIAIAGRLLGHDLPMRPGG